MDRKRGRLEDNFNGNGGAKKFRTETDSFGTGLGSKSKPCTKFFSTSGCPFGEGCHFLHYVPGGFKTASHMTNVGSNPAIPQVGRKMQSSRVAGRVEPPPAHGAAAGFGASATAKISINASLAGAVIGKNGVNSKQICRVTGARLSIREHDSDPNLRNIELEGSFDQIKQASAMVHELILNVSSVSGPPMKNIATQGSTPASNFKTKLCENFTKGSCTFGDRCHFAHGTDELRKPGM
ncbi:zinc finger CCCH domain-containing protein 36-like isoform X3 [Gastrolobium bilobum]|uniref:zinc finger CCCH domain-containing protein 36-like isoform X3 n=1 Tax=Gastrolobium bilobum TaxID=150636 RepID=UPI002AB23B48|nr:zinc finger CCCH domain-containing protein 36-like isoform X3 [Gastrolobium bilobum]